MFRSLLFFSAFLLSFAHSAIAQCSVTVTPNSLNACVGQPFTVTASQGANSYTWYDQMNQVVGTSAVATIIPPVAGTYSYTVEADFGTCTATASVQVTALPAPQPIPTSNNVICGGNLNLFVQTFTGATYAWMGPNGWASAMQNPVIMNATPLNAGVYTVNVTDPNGCSGMGSVNVVIGSSNQVVGSNNGIVCMGDLLELYATTITGATYTWTGPNGYTSNQQNPSFTVNGNVDGGIYTVTANENGCISTDTTLVVICNTIYVNNYQDANANCLFETGTDNYIYLPVATEIDSNGVILDTISSTSGFYYTPNGSAGDVYTFKIISLPGDLQTSCPVSGIVSHTLQSSGLTVIDMGMECNTANGFDLSILASNPTSGAVSQSGYFYANNSYCTPINSVVTLTHSPDYEYAFAYPAATSVNGSTITWDLNALSNTAPTIVYYTLINSGAPLISGDTTHSTFTISPTTGDLDITNNTFVKIDTVVASFDPNAITAFPAECVTAGTNMQYMIQFENLGNAPAENIYVLDTLPAELEFNTMELVMSSHNMFVTKIQEGGYNIFRFDFPNIMLSDSSDHAGRHGMLVYTIDLNSGLPYGTEIFHRAGIYFDYNDVVMTNNERTSICIPQNVSTTSNDAGMMLYPNPANNELMLQTNGSYTNCSVTNSIGQQMMEMQLDNKKTSIDISQLAPGMYYMNINGSQGTEVLKFIKM